MCPVILRTCDGLQAGHFRQRSGLRQCACDNDQNAPSKSLRTTVVENGLKVAATGDQPRHISLGIFGLQCHCLPARHESEREEEYLSFTEEPLPTYVSVLSLQPVA